MIEKLMHWINNSYYPVWKTLTVIYDFLSCIYFIIYLNRHIQLCILFPYFIEPILDENMLISYIIVKVFSNEWSLYVLDFAPVLRNCGEHKYHYGSLKPTYTSIM